MRVQLWDEGMFPVHCAWCGEQIGICEVEHSTGMCRECLDRLYPEQEEEAA